MEVACTSDTQAGGRSGNLGDWTNEQSDGPFRPEEQFRKQIDF